MVTGGTVEPSERIQPPDLLLGSRWVASALIHQGGWGGSGAALGKMSIEMREKREEKSRQRERRGLKNTSDWRGRGGDVRRERRLRAKQRVSC